MVVALFILSFLTGSINGSLPSDTDKHPFDPCPGSPNCIIQSLLFEETPEKLFAAAQSAMKKIDPFELDIQNYDLRINAVFRIPIFRFKDDVQIAVEESVTGGSYLHIKSASRVGHGDFGVNKRRVERIVSQIKTELEPNKNN
ncbi:MAG: DUF1499 domain-containing protein [Balneolaceae bacterium]|nr:MAG: DUF1499 domain-containing protein [Balneolaceae bacterium]